METHDRKQFEVFAYYCGINRTDQTQQRIMRGVDHWLDINPLNDDQAAAKMAEDGIDILVDLTATGCAYQGVRAPPGPDRGELVRIPRHNGDAI